MQNKIENLDGIIDQSLKTASTIISLVAFPAIIIAGYRNLFVDFELLHQIFITLCYVLFVFVAFAKTKSNKLRLYVTVIIYFSLFLLAGIRNSSIIFVDVFLVLACGLMAFKFSSRIVIASGVLATTTLYLVTTETFLPPNLSSSLYLSTIAVHLSCLTLICVLVFAIRTLVDQYEKMYLKEIEANKTLIEKNKSSYDLVAEAQESSEAEKTKLKIAAFSLASQMDLTKSLLENTNKKKDNLQVEHIRDRVRDVSFNLSKISETGNYLSDDTATLTLQDLSHILKKFTHPYEFFSDWNGMKVEMETSSVSEIEYSIPVSSLKVMLHHLISHCQEIYEPKELKFEISEGRQSQTMKEVQLTALIATTRNSEELNLARFNKIMESKLNFKTGAPHTNLIKAVLSSLPGSIRATLIGNKVRLDTVFWVELGEVA